MDNYFITTQRVECDLVPLDARRKSSLTCSKFSSVAQSCSTLCNTMGCSIQPSLSITNSQSSLKLMSIESVMPSNPLILYCPLLLPPSIFPSIRVFSNDSVLPIRSPKYWSFSFSISPSNECSGLVSFRMDWFDLLAVQGTLKSLLQHHSSKPSILQWSAFFIVQRTIYSFFIVQDLSEPLKSWCASWNLLVPSGACSWCFLVLFEYRTLWSSTCSFSSLNTLFVGDCFWELGKLQPFLLQTGQQRPRP